MLFKLTTTSSWYRVAKDGTSVDENEIGWVDDEYIDALKAWGFSLRSLDRASYTYYEHLQESVTIEISSLDELLSVVRKVGIIEMDPDEITIVDRHDW